MNFPSTRYQGSDTDTSVESLEAFETLSPFSEKANDEHEHDHDHEAIYSEPEYDESEAYPDTEYGVEENFSEDESYSHYRILTEQEIADEITKQTAKKKPACKSKLAVTAGRIKWMKEALNKQLGLSLKADDKVDDQTTKAIGAFQQKFNLKQTQQLDPATERRLMEEDALKRQSPLMYPAALGVITLARTRIEDWTSRAQPNSRGLVLNQFRNPDTVKAFVLHQMAFHRKNRKNQLSDPESYLRTGAHFCIMLDGRIIQLHRMTKMIWHAQCLSSGSVGVEFEGNFPNIKGHWWKDKDAKAAIQDQPTQAQYDSGRFLTSYLKMVLGITHIHAHRQSSSSRENDPGPDIWFNVGQWAIDKLGLTDGGPAYKCCSGNPIMPEWRVARKTSSTPSVQKFHIEEGEYDDHEWGNTDAEGEWIGETERFEDNTYNEIAGEVTDVGRVGTLNQYYGAKLGWHAYFDRINDLLLPYSGQSNVSLGNEAFAYALSQWQRRNGFSEKDSDGILGPATWRVMQPMLVSKPSVPPPSYIPGTPTSSAPSVQNVLAFNQWHAQRILELMSQGVISSNKFDSKLQLEKLSRGEKVLQVDPQIKLVRALPVICHIAQQAKSNNYYDIVIGSFIRDASGGKCTGHCEGRCIDINYKQGSFESNGAAQMVINILTYLVTLPSAYRKSLGFGMPMQGDFFGKGLTKFNSVDASLLRNQQLASLVRQNGAYVFPDNDNHLHIQVNWTA